MSESLATRGYIAPLPGSPLPATINVIAVTVTATYLDIQFSVPVFLAPYGWNATNWTITSVAGVFYPTTPIGISEASADTIRLLVDEMTDGASFSLDLVVGLVESVAADASNMQESWPFTGVGVAPVVVTAASQSARTTLVTFDKPMHPADLADTTRFYVSGPTPFSYPLPVNGAAGQTGESSLLTTDIIKAGGEYAVISAARSRAGNANPLFLTADQAVVADSPTGLYLMDDTFGVVLTDSSGGGDNGTLNFALGYSGVGHTPTTRSLYSNGAGAFATLGPSAFRPAQADPWSFEFWYYSTWAFSGILGPGIMGNLSGGEGVVVSHANFLGTLLLFAVYGSGAGNNIAVSAPAPGQWTHYCFTCAGGATIPKAYINGAAAVGAMGYTAGNLVADPVYSAPFVVGFANGSSVLSGTGIDNIAFWVGTELTAQQVSEHVNGRFI